MFKKKPSPKIIPTVAMFFTYSDNAIAQTTQQPQPLPQPQPQLSTDPLSILGYAALGITALWGVGSQLISKAGIVAIASRERKINQELSQDAAINDGYVKQADKSFDALIRLLDTAIGNILQTSRETKEIFYIGHERTAENTKAIVELAVLVEKNSDDIKSILKLQRDIMNVLRMKFREGDNTVE